MAEMVATTMERERLKRALTVSRVITVFPETQKIYSIALPLTK
jgi:hypothetical protein